MQLSRTARQFYTRLIPYSVRRRIEKVIAGNYPRIYDRRRFIFVHIPKTAGKSVCEMIGVSGACHLTYAQYEALIGERINDYFVFTVVRHPVDRLVSAWTYMRDGGNHSYEDLAFKKQWIDPCDSFEEFVREALLRPEVFGLGKFRPQTDFLAGSDGCLVDRIKLCRFESLQADLLKLPPEILRKTALPHVNASRRGAERPGADIVMRIGEIYRRDFEYLGYTLAP